MVNRRHFLMTLMRVGLLIAIIAHGHRVLTSGDPPVLPAVVLVSSLGVSSRPSTASTGYRAPLCRSSPPRPTQPGPQPGRLAPTTQWVAAFNGAASRVKPRARRLGPLATNAGNDDAAAIDEILSLAWEPDINLTTSGADHAEGTPHATGRARTPCSMSFLGRRPSRAKTLDARRVHVECLRRR